MTTHADSGHALPYREEMPNRKMHKAQDYPSFGRDTRLLPLVALLALASCATPHWQAPRAGTASVDIDLTACTQAAQKNSSLYSPSVPAGPQFLPFSGRGLANPTSDIPEELLLQQNLTNLCMQNKGYRLSNESATASREP
jgi:hypothetical protein